MLVFTWELFMTARKVVFKLFDRNAQSDQKDDVILHVQTRYLVQQAVAPILEKSPANETAVTGAELAAGDTNVTNPPHLNDSDPLANGPFANALNTHDGSCIGMTVEQQVSEFEDNIKKLINSQLHSENAVSIQIHDAASADQVHCADTVQDSDDKSSNIEQYVSNELMRTLERAVENFMSIRCNIRLQSSELCADSKVDCVPPSEQTELLAAMDTFVSQCSLRSSAEETDIRNGPSLPQDTSSLTGVDRTHVIDASTTRSNIIVAADGRCIELAQANFSGAQSAPSSGICLSAITSQLGVNDSIIREVESDSTVMDTPINQEIQDNSCCVSWSEDEEDRGIEMLIDGIIKKSASAIAEERRNGIISAYPTLKELAFNPENSLYNELSRAIASASLDNPDDTQEADSSVENSELKDDEEARAEKQCSLLIAVDKHHENASITPYAPDDVDDIKDISNVENVLHISECDNEKVECEHNEWEVEVQLNVDDDNHFPKDSDNSSSSINDMDDKTAKYNDYDNDHVLSTSHQRASSTNRFESITEDVVGETVTVDNEMDDERLFDSKVLPADNDVLIKQRQRTSSDVQVTSISEKTSSTNTSYVAVPQCNFRMLYSDFVHKRSMPGLNCISDMVTDMMSSTDPRMRCGSLTGAISRVTKQDSVTGQQKKKMSHSISIDEVDSAAERDISLDSDGTISAESLKYDETPQQERVLNKVSAELATDAVNGAFNELQHETQSAAGSNSNVTDASHCPMSDHDLHYRSSQMSDSGIPRQLPRQKLSDEELDFAGTNQHAPNLNALRKLNYPVTGLTETSSYDTPPSIASKVATMTRQWIEPDKVSNFADHAIDTAVSVEVKDGYAKVEPMAKLGSADNKAGSNKKSVSDKGARVRKLSGANNPKQAYATPTPIRISKDVISSRQKPLSKVATGKPSNVKTAKLQTPQSVQAKLAKLPAAKSRNTGSTVTPPLNDSLLSDTISKNTTNRDKTAKTKVALPSRNRHSSMEPVKSKVDSFRPRARSASVSISRPNKVEEDASSKKSAANNKSCFVPKATPSPRSGKSTPDGKPIRPLTAPTKDTAKTNAKSFIAQKVAKATNSLQQKTPPKTKVSKDVTVSSSAASRSTKTSDNSSTISNSKVIAILPLDAKIDLKLSAERKAWLSSFVAPNSPKAVATQSSESVTSDVIDNEKTVNRPHKKSSSSSSSKTSCTAKTNSANKVSGFPKWNAYPAKSDVTHTANKARKGEKDSTKDGRAEAKSEPQCNRTSSTIPRPLAKKPLLLDTKRANTFRNLSKSNQQTANETVSTAGDVQMKTETQKAKAKAGSARQYGKWNKNNSETIADEKKTTKRWV